MARGMFADLICGGALSARQWVYRLAVLVLLGGVAAAAMPSGAAWAQSYTFNRFEVRGNQRVHTETILTYAGLQRGKEVTAGELNAAYQKIIESGVFESVDLDPRGNTLVISVVEYPTINIISFEGNKRLDDDALGELIESSSRRVFNAAQAERDAALIAEAYSQQGRIAARVTPRIIRRSDNRVDLVFEIAEGGAVEIERVSFVGNRVYSDRRLRRVMETKQAGLLRAFFRSDTLIEDRIEFDKQVLTDFYMSRGYIDFRVLSANVELTREKDAFFLVMNVQEGQQFKFGQISTTSEMSQADADIFQDALKIKPGVVYSPSLVEESIARLERLGIRQGIDFLRVEPRITRNDPDLTLDIEFVLTKGPRIFVERIDIEGNTTTLDRVIRQQFRIVEGDPFNPREIRESAERIRALGFFAAAGVQAREGSSNDQVVIDVDVEEQATGSLNVGGSYSTSDGFGVAIGLTENNFLGRGQRLNFEWSNAAQSEKYIIGFTEPNLLGRRLRFDLDLGYSEADSNYASFDNDRTFFIPSVTFRLAENSRLNLRYEWDSKEMSERDDVTTGDVVEAEIGQGDLSSSALGLRYVYDTRLTGLNPNAGVLFEIGAAAAGLGGDNEFIKTSGRVVAQTRIRNEEVRLRASLEFGALNWRGNTSSRTVDRYQLGPQVFRGFEPGGIGPRDQSNGADDPLGGNYYGVLRLEADFPLGLPEEYGIRGGIFYDIGNLWGLGGANTSGVADGVGGIRGRNGSLRQVIGVSILWDTLFGPLRFNFSKALELEDFDKEQTFDLTIQATF